MEETREEFLTRAMAWLREDSANRLIVDNETFAPCFVFEGEKLMLEAIQDEQTMKSHKE
jgi:hypothetical protein